MTRRMLAAFCVAVMVPAMSVRADWNPGDPYKMHYPQLPDLTPHGLDVLAGPSSATTPAQVHEKFLADDWLCTSTGPVTDIHIWGSYNQDIPLIANPSNTNFSLVIYDNIPAGVGGANYSRPGQPLWSAYVKPTATRIYATAQEQFFDPNLNAIVGTDTQVWQYNFLLPAATSFHQTAGNIYWLGVHHTFDLNGDGVVGIVDASILASRAPSAFGWKTSGVQHFEDDAVWTDVSTFGTANPHVVPVGPWSELHHPQGGESLDLAFVITGVPEPGTIVLLVIGGIGSLAVRRRPSLARA